jgi:hypothetical protein
MYFLAFEVQLTSTLDKRGHKMVRCFDPVKISERPYTCTGYVQRHYMSLPIDQRVVLIVGLTVAVIFTVIAVRVATGRRWRNRLPFIDKSNNQAVLTPKPSAPCRLAAYLLCV